MFPPVPPTLNVAGRNRVSTVSGKPAANPGFTVVPHATSPVARFPTPTPPAEFVQPAVASGTVASSFTTIDVGTAGVNVLLIRSCRALNDTNPFGVTGHEQHAIICSSGEKAYTFAQIAPVVVAEVPAANPAPRAPVFVRLITESPRFRCDTYLTW